MPSKPPSLPEVKTLFTGLAFGESPRWHDGRLWFSNWGAQEVIAVDLDGNSDVILRMPSFPFSIDWLPDGRLLITSGRDGLLQRMEPGGSLVTHADLTGLSDRGCLHARGRRQEKLFMMAAEWRGPAKMTDAARTGQVLTVEAPAPGVGWP